MVNAGWISSWLMPQSIAGHCSAGRPPWKGPNSEPIVAIPQRACKPQPATTAVATIKPAMAPGT